MLTAPITITPEVIDALNGELAYQASLHSRGKADELDHGIAGQLVTLSVYAREAESAWAKGETDEAALDAMRKVAAIAVRALVLYGCPKREPNNANH